MSGCILYLFVLLNKVEKYISVQRCLRNLSYGDPKLWLLHTAGLKVLDVGTTVFKNALDNKLMVVVVVNQPEYNKNRSLNTIVFM